jgi:SAM-dependent methyltransferase
MLAPVHEHLFRALRPAAGARWLDVGTGTGALAFLAARAGADVTGVDLAPSLIETAIELASEQGLAVKLEVGDAESLPVEDSSFDVVSSSMGLIFAPDHRATASELARVCKPGGRIGFSAWRKDAGISAITRRYSPPLEPGQGDSADWGREQYAQELLGDSFELEFEEGDAPVVGESGEEVWSTLLSGAGPFKARAESLEPERREELHREFVEYLESFRGEDGISLPAPFLVVLGTRR